MLDIFHFVLLALIQGITEFLPISSSAHLLVPGIFFGWPDQGLAYDIAVHLELYRRRFFIFGLI